jgi:hypothetical protein
VCVWGEGGTENGCRGAQAASEVADEKERYEQQQQAIKENRLDRYDCAGAGACGGSRGWGGGGSDKAPVCWSCRVLVGCVGLLLRWGRRRSAMSSSSWQCSRTAWTGTDWGVGGGRLGTGRQSGFVRTHACSSGFARSIEGSVGGLTRRVEGKRGDGSC